MLRGSNDPRHIFQSFILLLFCVQPLPSTTIHTPKCLFDQSNGHRAAPHSVVKTEMEAVKSSSIFRMAWYQ